jgi:hypothetical protein
MTFIGLVEGTKSYIFMRSPNNIVFTTIQALFNETVRVSPEGLKEYLDSYLISDYLGPSWEASDW